MNHKQVIMMMSIVQTVVGFFKMPQINQTRETLVTPAFFNYQILKSMPLENAMLFNVINDVEWSQFGGNTASVAISFDALLVHKGFEQ